MNYGMKVKIEFKKGLKEVYRNVTEIHYNYKSPITKLVGSKIVFESDIHGMGITQPINEIKEFETELETKKAKSF